MQNLGNYVVNTIVKTKPKKRLHAFHDYLKSVLFLYTHSRYNCRFDIVRVGQLVGQITWAQKKKEIHKIKVSKD